MKQGQEFVPNKYPVSRLPIVVHNLEPPIRHRAQICAKCRITHRLAAPNRYIVCSDLPMILATCKNHAMKRFRTQFFLPAQPCRIRAFFYLRLDRTIGETFARHYAFPILRVGIAGTLDLVVRGFQPFKIRLHDIAGPP